MTYGYIRVSTDKQDTANQKFEIQNFAIKNNILIDEWVEETISGTTRLEKRLLNKLLKKMGKDDTMIACELSRLGRSLLQIMSILHGCLDKEVQVWTIKDNYRLGNDISSKVLAFAFGLSAEIERNLISQRTIEALKRKKAEGMRLGRPVGSQTKKSKLDEYTEKIIKWLKEGYSFSLISRKLKCHRTTIAKFCTIKGLREKPNQYPHLTQLAIGVRKNSDIDLSNAVKLYESGKPFYEIAAHYKISPHSLTKLLKENGDYHLIEMINKQQRTDHPSTKIRY